MERTPSQRNLGAQLAEIRSAASSLSILAQDSLKGAEGEACSYLAARIAYSGGSRPPIPE